MTRLGQTIPALPARDVAAALDFYRDRLGFEVAYQVAGFAIVRRDDAVIHLWQADDEAWRGREVGAAPVCSGAESFIAGTASCRIAVEGIDPLFDELARADVLHPVSKDGVIDTDHGTREINALDCDGNLLTFFE